MIFSLSIGSEGIGVERYLAYLPFVVAEGSTFAPTEGSVSSQYGTHTIRLMRLHNCYAISSGPHPSEAEAEAYIEALRATLLWLSLTHGVGISYPRTVGRPQLYELPQPVTGSSSFADMFNKCGWDAVDGDYDARKAVILPSHKRLSRIECGTASIVIGFSAENFITYLQEALSFDHLSDVNGNDKLKLAIEVYAAYRFEVSDNAKLLTLVSALEALSPDTGVSAIAAGALKEVKKLLKESRGKYASGTPERADVELLLSRVGNLKKEAIGTSLRLYISNVLVRNPALGDQESVLAQLKKAYDTRSTLLHEGRAGSEEINDSLRFLQEFVPRLLKALFLEVAGSCR